mgnify:CR=1 FL=1
MTGLLALQHHPFSVTLDVFEGPLDLLLSLVLAATLEITEISLVQVTGQYLAHVRQTEAIDHRDLAEFVAIGARLIELKSRALLPSPPPPETQEEDEPDPESLVELLRRYQQFKQAAALLREREEETLRAFPRLAPPPDVPSLPGLSHTTLERLAAIVGNALARAEPPPEPERYPLPRFTVRQKMEEIALLLRLGGRLSVERVVGACRSRDEVIVVFFAVLEMAKSGLLAPVQPEPFGDILLLPCLPADDGAGRDGGRAGGQADGEITSPRAAARNGRSEPKLAGVEDSEGIGRALDLAQEVHA